MAQFEQWAKEAGGGITVTQESTFLKPSITRIDVPNQFWMAIQNAAKIVYVIERSLSYIGN